MIDRGAGRRAETDADAAEYASQGTQPGAAMNIPTMAVKTSSMTTRGLQSSRYSRHERAGAMEMARFDMGGVTPPVPYPWPVARAPGERRL